MKVVILPSAELGLRWYEHYYEDIFPEGRKNAKLRFSATLRVLESNPHIGTKIEGLSARKIPISGTPFQFVYRIGKGRVEILKLWDGRGNPINLATGI
jgi:plasmid stabilization system protein ParE